MEDRLKVYRERRERGREYREAAAKGCYSLIIIVVALILLRPVMVGQILSLASAYSSVGLLDDSLRQCNKALLIDGDSSEVWRRSAQVYRAQGDRELAYGAYRKAMDADPANRAAHFELGRMYVEDDRHPLAIPCFEQVRRLGPDRITGSGCTRASYHRASLDMLMLCYEKEGDPAKLELVLREARLFYPDGDKTERHSARPAEWPAGDS